jgi:hypothetical protein
VNYIIEIEIEMNRIIKLSVLLLSIAFVAGCNDAKIDDLFAGNDRYIVAFSLKQGETVLQAVVAGDVVTITAPEGFSLMQAKATVRLSENATIYPDPATITDWEEEWLFTVTAYNGAQSKYKYTVERSGVALSGTVILETQAEVEAFGAQGITFIDGNLTIGRTTGTDSITSLAPLNTLKEVVYTLTLQPTCAVTDLNGLDNLERVGGVLQIGGDNVTTMLKHFETLSLPALKSIGSINLRSAVTAVVDLPELTDLTKQFNLNCPIYQLRMPNLRYAGTLNFVVASNTGTSLATVSLPALEEVGNITLEYLRNITKVELPELKKAGTLKFSQLTLLSLVYAPVLEEITGEINLYILPALNEFGFPKLKKGSLYTWNCAKLSDLDFPSLTEMDHIYFYNTPIKGLTPFVALKTVGKVTLVDNSAGDRFTVPSSIQYIGALNITVNSTSPPSEIDIKGKSIGIFSFITNRAIANTRIIGDEVFHGALILNYNSAPVQTFSLSNLEGFREVDSLSISSNGSSDVIISGITKVNGGAYFTANYSGYPKSFVLEDLEEVGGSATFNFQQWYVDAETSNIGSLKRVGGKLSVLILNYSSKTLTFPNLETVGGDFDLSASYDMYNRHGYEELVFPKLITVGGKLSISSGNNSYTNNMVKNLDGFSALQSVKAVEIKNLVSLTSYEGLQNAFNSLSDSGSWNVSGNAYNPTYEDLLAGKWSK